MAEFVRDIEDIRRRARQSIEDGPVTSAYQIDKDVTINVLNEALATEIVCVLRYLHHYFMATGVHGKAVAAEFKEHADAEREHADDLAERIQQLGGKPDFNPASLVGRSVAQYVEGETLGDMIREDLVAERMVIELYTEMIRFFADKDPTTRVLLERLLADEEEHANDLADLLFIVEPTTGKEKGEDPGTHALSEVSAHHEPQTEPEQVEERGPQPVATRPSPRAERGLANQAQGEARPARATGKERPDASGMAPAHPPGTTGRPTRSHAHQEIEVDMPPGTSEEEAGQTGSTRAARVTRPNRKQRLA